ncbi:uncharacterized protein VTP21DRAFT_7743 [Calcarisporiella thermophila]|uniref:uncharacterized protein n=1 Tax=Calcarisporiella thermophila TaxID=911321 RepID=UPI003743CFD1
MITSRQINRSILILVSVVFFANAIVSLAHRDTTRTLLKRDLGEQNCKNPYESNDYCEYVKSQCGDFTDGMLNYLEVYFCTFSPVRPLGFGLLFIWLLFLFGFVGIAASDFFCPDLATIASSLNLSESVAGVTFLAIGNGSPDVFSTFSAMKTNAGSLAFGELLGAAAFISSVVTGSMALVTTFSVSKRSFIRDLLFFAFAVLLVLLMVMDEKLYFYECLLLILYYAAYVVVVVGGSYVKRRIGAYQELMQRARNEYEDAIETQREELENLLAGNDRIHQEQLQRERQRQQQGQQDLERANDFRISPRLQVDTTSFIGPDRSREEIQHYGPFTAQPLGRGFSYGFPSVVPRSRTHDYHGAHRDGRRPTGPGDLFVGGVHMHLHTPRPGIRPSLVTAIEFRDVVNSLQRLHLPSQESVRAFTTSTSGPHASRLQTPAQGRLKAGSCPGRLRETEDEAAIYESPSSIPQLGPGESEERSDYFGAVGPAAGASQELRASQAQSARDEIVVGKRTRLQAALKRVLATLFPSLHGWQQKSLFSKVLSILVCPIQFAMILTLPVVDEAAMQESNSETIGMLDAISEEREGLLSNTEDDSDREEETGNVDGAEQERLSANNLTVEEYSSELPEVGGWCQWLSAVQLVLSPMFATTVICVGWGHSLTPVLFVAGIGAIAALLLLVFTHPHKIPRHLYLMCYLGFLAAICWIYIIANEVVAVLKSIGLILGLSDAILGLTIFAMGNSLGDFVANITMARMGFPMMAFSACYGGPLLNMLLGIGIGGLYTTWPSRGVAYYPLKMSVSLLVTSLGLILVLVLTLVIVPLNGYKVTRKWGLLVMGIYFIGMGMNVVLEMKGKNKSFSLEH